MFAHGNQSDRLGGLPGLVVHQHPSPKQLVQMIQIELQVIDEHHEMRLERTGPSTGKNVGIWVNVMVGEDGFKIVIREHLILPASVAGSVALTDWTRICIAGLSIAEPLKVVNRSFLFAKSFQQ